MHLFFAGGEAHFDRLYDNGVRKILFSYYYMYQKGLTDLNDKLKLEGREKVKVMIDSGAFTLRRENVSKTEAQAYFDSYIKFLIKNRKYISYAFELDIENVVGDDVVAEWRKRLQKVSEKFKIKIFYVWHVKDRFQGWKEMCQRYKYVAIPQTKFDKTQYMRMVREANKNGCKVHGLAMTKPPILVHVPFFSVDSTSWINGMKMGTTFVFTGHKMEIFDHTQKHLRVKYKRKFIKMGLDWKLIKHDDWREVTRANIMGWLETEVWINKRLRAKVNRLKNIDSESSPTPTDTSTSDTIGTGLVLVSVGASALAKQSVSLLDLPGVPKLACKTCHIGDDCDLFKETRTECAYKLQEFPINIDTDDPLLHMQLQILKTDHMRWQRQIQFETQGGGYVDRTVQALGDSIVSRTERLIDQLKPKGGAHVPPPTASDAAIRAAAEGTTRGLLGGFFDRLSAAQGEPSTPKSLPDGDPATEDGSTPASAPVEIDEGITLMPPEAISPVDALARDKEIARRKKH